MKTPNILLIICTLFCVKICNAQVATSTVNRIESYKNAKSKLQDLNSIAFKNIGPTIMSGRVTDLAVNPNNTNEFYAAYASGGLWHTLNNGLSFTPIFDNEASITIGAIAVNWKKNIIWVGTGEANSSRSSYAGTGVYKSIDTGKTWQYCGLPESHHIGKIVLDETNENVAFVAVLGHLYSKNSERGLYKTKNGGTTWKQTLSINDSTGCVDICADAKNKNILYTTSWTRTRTAWQFTGQGEGSGIYKSTDAGESWQLISGGKSGFPKNKNIGRIGISVCNNNPNTIYALLDNQNNREPNSTKKSSELKASEIKNMSTNKFLEIPEKELSKYLNNNNYPKTYTATTVKEDIKNNKYTVADIANWVLADANNALFDTPVIGAELYKSTDAGKTWAKTHTTHLDGLFFTYGYYFATVQANPVNENEVYLLGYTAIKTDDGGKTFKDIAKGNCHADYHRIWINTKQPKHLIVGNDGGINITYDDGQKWYKANNPTVGQFYSITTDDAKPYNVYGGLQDNGTWIGPSNYTNDDAWHQDGIYPYKAIGGGDGMQVQVDTRDNKTMYTGYQFGYYQRQGATESDALEIHPTHNIGEKALRFNWQTPIHLSKHNQDILYYGANCFFRSLQKGDDIKKMSSDLTSTKNSGNVPYGTITSITESPLQFGLLYIGTDDGNIHISKNVGHTWEKINTNNLPKNLWVSRVVASAYNEATAYVTFNGYRNDNFTPYIFATNNHGKTWLDISGNLPKEPINVMREDPKDSNIIYVGTDNGLYVSFNKGKTYEPWQGQLPRVAIHDIAIQARENEIVLGTHGRSIYTCKLDKVQILQKMRSKNLDVLPMKIITYNSNWGNAWAIYADALEPEMDITFYTKTAGNYSIQIKDVNNKTHEVLAGKAIEGFNIIKYNANTKIKKNTLSGKNNKNYLGIGKYNIEILVNGFSANTTCNIVDADKK